jgi:hypothetical protein
MKLFGIFVGFDITSEILVIFSAFFRQKKWEYNDTEHKLYIDLRKPTIQLRSAVQYSQSLRYP